MPKAASLAKEEGFVSANHQQCIKDRAGDRLISGLSFSSLPPLPESQRSSTNCNTAMFAKFTLISALATSSALAQSSYITGLLNTFRDNGLTAVADLLASFDGSTLSALESAISSGNHTGFIPDNGALANLPSSWASNVTQAQQVLSYHFLNGAVNTNDTSPDKLTIARTTLTGPPTVNLRMFHVALLAFRSEAVPLPSGRPASGYRAQ